MFITKYFTDAQDETETAKKSEDTRAASKLPSHIWREDRAEYKSHIMCDFACPAGFIPEDISKFLVTDWMRLVYKQTKRMVLSIQGWHDNSDVTPAVCMHDLYRLNTIRTSDPCKRREIILSRLDSILYHACEIDDMGFGCCYDDMLSYIDEINFCTHDQDIETTSELEELILHPSTESKVDRKGIEYIVNVELKFCSCREMEGRDDGTYCEHLNPNIIEVEGSNNSTYFVDKEQKTCTCKGFQFKKSCKHVKKYC